MSVYMTYKVCLMCGAPVSVNWPGGYYTKIDKLGVLTTLVF